MNELEFEPAMTQKELLDGEKLHLEIEETRKLVMAAGLTKSSVELEESWDIDPETYTTLLKGAVAAYEHNELLEELLRSSVARLVWVTDKNDITPELLERCKEIAIQKMDEELKTIL